MHMAIVLKDRVKVLSTTTGTGTLTLGSAVTGYQSFSVIGDGNSTYYTIAAQATPDWEVGIGTYTASGTLLSRDTILESSNGGAAVDFPAGIKDVFVTYPAERSVYLDSAGSYPVQNTFNTLNAANAVLTAGTISTTPVSGTDIVNKTYVDTIASSGIHFHTPVRVESPTALTVTYNNGTSGVGATLTNAGTQVALVIDGITLSVSDRVLIYTQADATQNGVYVVTNVGSGSTNWVLTRATDADTYGFAGPTTLSEGSTFFVTSGNTGAGETYTCNTIGTITFGTTNITFAQISAAQIYSAGTGLTLTNTTFSITNTGTAGTYGSASNVPVFVTNAQGQVTSVTNTAIAIAAGAVSGLAASATTDTTNASNITSGTLGTGRISGSYTGITGVGTLTAGTWNGSTIAANYGGTGYSSYTVGDLLYSDTSSTLAKLADVAVGNALISGGVAAAPSWGKIGLSTHVSGTLPVANGGTGITSLGAGVATFLGTPSSANLAAAVTDETGSGALVFATSPTLVTPALGTPSSGTLTNATGLPIVAGTTGTLSVARGGTGDTTYTNGQLLIGNTTGNTLTKATLTAGTGITVTNGTGSISIAAINNGTVTSVASGTGLTGGPITTTGTLSVATNGISDTLLRDSAALSVIGRSANSTGDPADIAAASDHQVLRRSGTALGFGAVALNQSNAITGTLPVANGGTGITSLGAGVATFLGTPSSANLAAAVTGETGSGALVFGTSPTLASPTFNDGYTEEVFAVTGTTPALSPANGSIQTWTLSGNSTPTAGTWNAGQSITLMIDDGSAATVTWTSLAVTWKTDGGNPPTLNTTGFTVITLWKVSTTIYGARVGDA
jgi:hypothetical protein